MAHSHLRICMIVPRGFALLLNLLFLSGITFAEHSGKHSLVLYSVYPFATGKTNNSCLAPKSYTKTNDKETIPATNSVNPIDAKNSVAIEGITFSEGQRVLFKERGQERKGMIVSIGKDIGQPFGRRIKIKFDNGSEIVLFSNLVKSKLTVLDTEKKPSVSTFDKEVLEVFDDPHIYRDDEFGMALRHMVNPPFLTRESIEMRKQVKQAGVELQRFVDRQAKRYGIRHKINVAIALGGSVAKGYAGPESDVEIEIFFLTEIVLDGPDGLNERNRFKKSITRKIQQLLHRKVDMLWYSSVENGDSKKDDGLWRPFIYGDRTGIDQARRAEVEKARRKTQYWEKMVEQWRDRAIVTGDLIREKESLRRALTNAGVDTDDPNAVDLYLRETYAPPILPSFSTMEKIFSGLVNNNADQDTDHGENTPKEDNPTGNQLGKYYYLTHQAITAMRVQIDIMASGIDDTDRIDFEKQYTSTVLGGQKDNYGEYYFWYFSDSVAETVARGGDIRRAILSMRRYLENLNTFFDICKSMPYYSKYTAQFKKLEESIANLTETVSKLVTTYRSTPHHPPETPAMRSSGSTTAPKRTSEVCV